MDGHVRLFRPDLNMKRMNSSAVRACLPTFDGEQLTKLIAKLVAVDAKWVPTSPVASLYLRPTLIATEASLGVGQSNSALLFVLTGPVGPYYPTGFQPVSLLADPSYVRAWPGGSGNTKMGANYAPTLAVQKIAQDRGCQQVRLL
jgi:branched-chain amino acid aminotransferase